LPDIFLSYSRQDQAIARHFAEGFQRAGLTVWWDATLEAGEAYDQVTEKALKEAKAVVVLWSRTSVDSRWVRAEATLADRLKTLVPVMIEACERPIMFELTQTADLSQWNGDERDSAWGTYLAGLQRFVGKESSGKAAIAPGADPARQRLPSIAVLPFANMSGDKEQEYFSDGLAEEIINTLAQIPELKVVARTSTFAFRGQNTDIRRIAAALGVTHVLEGSVRRAGNRIRVTAQLITANDGIHLWSERYDRELADVFAVQDEISRAISDALKVRLATQPSGKPRHTPSLPAYEALLKARHLHQKVTPEGTDLAKMYYEQAIALDPQYALALAEYAQVPFAQSAMGLSPMREAAPITRSLALRALELDPSMLEAHGILCMVAAAYDYDWQEAGRQFAMAAPGDRSSPVAQFMCGSQYLLASGRSQEAMEQLTLAVRGDPINLLYRVYLALALDALDQQDEAETVLRQALELDSNYILTWIYQGILKAVHGKYSEALTIAEKAYSQMPSMPNVVGLYAGLLVRTGERELGNEVIQALGTGETYGTSKGLANFYVLCGDLDAAARWFEKAIQERDPGAPIHLRVGLGRALLATPHWPRLASLMNLPVEKRAP
jgi:TolB-like protein/Tfp pilus assembly protein PilF